VDAPVSLSLVIHNHQPVGNFGWVIEDVYEHAYSPMLDALERHPGIHLGLHYTGPLLQWMAANRPSAIDQIKRLIDRGQVEIVGGGFYEPILITLPDRDRHGQLVRMADELEATFGHRPTGAWLAERVWEPSLAYDLAAAGYGWTVLDDTHLRAASIKEDQMWTAFTTDDRGKRLTVFGTEQGLRYRIPFKPVDDVISYLRDRVSVDGRFVGMMGDDGEKFGAWPGTYEYCWSNEHWVDRCFEALAANADWLATVTPTEWLTSQPPSKRIYFPTASYVEMTQWALPADESRLFAKLLAEAREKDLPTARFLRGGFWRNFLARYHEINEMHKQMLRASDKVAAMAPGRAAEVATDHLYQGQSNDCYWHGMFGGIYIVHMRLATLAHLIAAEDIADAAAAEAGTTTFGARMADTDLDAIDEVLVTSPGQTVVIDIAEGANVSSWDLRASRLATASVLRRRPEVYHQLLSNEATAAVNAAEGTEADAAPRTIHDIVASKEAGLAAFLHYDRCDRRSGLVHLLPANLATETAAFVRSDYQELGDFAEAVFETVALDDHRFVARRAGLLRAGDAGRQLVVEKTYRFGGDRINPTLILDTAVENACDSPLAFELAVEWNANMLGGGHNPDAYYETAETAQTQEGPGGRIQRMPHDTPGELPLASVIVFGNDYEGVRVEAHAEPAARLAWYPVETVSNSEAGFERVYQGSSLLFRWPVALAAGERRTFTVRFDVAQTIDRAAAELKLPGSPTALDPASPRSH
jgi:alpha-amylase